jgi:hypothetical protein
MASTEERIEKVKIPQLIDIERLELQNLLLKINIDVERIKRFELEIRNARDRVKNSELLITAWNQKFNTKLHEVGLDISKVDINAENGEVVPAKYTIIHGEESA